MKTNYTNFTIKTSNINTLKHNNKNNETISIGPFQSASYIKETDDIEIGQVSLSGNQIENSYSFKNLDGSYIINPGIILSSDNYNATQDYSTDLPIDYSINKTSKSEEFIVPVIETTKNGDTTNLEYTNDETNVIIATSGVNYISDNFHVEDNTEGSAFVNGSLTLGCNVINTECAYSTEDSSDERIELVIAEESINNENPFVQEQDPRRKENSTVLKIPQFFKNVDSSQNNPKNKTSNISNQPVLVYAKKSTITDNIYGSKEDVEFDYIGSLISNYNLTKNLDFKDNERTHRKLTKEVSKVKEVIDLNRKSTTISKREQNRIYCKAHRLKQ